MLKRNKKLIIVGSIIAGVLLLGAAVYIGGGIFWQKKIIAPKGVILFYGTGCDHCITVDDYIKKNSVESKVSFIRLEVFSNADNATILADKAQQCGLDFQKIGVPFLWDGQHCFIGYVDVIKFFQNKIRQKSSK
jgi:glutaredoxin